MDKRCSSVTPRDDVEQRFSEIQVGRMAEQQSFTDSLDPNADSRNFFIQERKRSVLSTISEKDNEDSNNSEFNLTEITPQVPAEFQKLDIVEPSASKSTNEECKLPLSIDSVNIPWNSRVRENVSNKSVLLDENINEPIDEVPKKRGFRIIKQVVKKVEGMYVVLPDHEVKAVARISEEVNRQLLSGSRYSADDRKFAALRPEYLTRSSVQEIIKELEETFKSSQQHESPNTKHSPRKDQENTDDGSLQPPVPVQDNKRNRHETGRTEERVPEKYFSPRRPEILKTIEADKQETTTSTLRRRYSALSEHDLGSEWESVCSASEVEKFIETREMSFNDSDDESSHGFMETLYYLSTIDCCSVL